MLTSDSVMSNKDHLMPTDDNEGRTWGFVLHAHGRSGGDRTGQDSHEAASEAWGKVDHII